MTVSKIKYSLPIISVLMIFALSFCSCTDSIKSGIYNFFGDDLTEYSYNTLKSQLASAVEKSELECKLRFRLSGGQNLADTVNEDISRLYEDDEYISYYVDSIDMSYSESGPGASVVCSITYNDSAVSRDEIIDVDEIGAAKACESAAKVLQTGSDTVVLHSSEGFDNDSIQTIINTVSVSSGTAYTFDDYSYKYYSDKIRKIVELRFLNNISPQRRAELNNQLYNKVDEIAEKIAAENAGENKKRICLAIHNYICENAQYDYDIVSESVKTDDALIKRSAFGALIDGKTICSGYSSAFLLLYNKIIGDGQCKIAAGAQGEGDDKQGHAWNIVRDNGAEYYIDCTFDDNDGGGYGFDYFYEPTDSEFFELHVIEDQYIIEFS